MRFPNISPFQNESPNICLDLLCFYLIGKSFLPWRCWKGEVFFVFEVVGAGMKWRGGGMRGRAGLGAGGKSKGEGPPPLLLLLQCFTTSIPLCSTQSCTVSRSSAPLGFPVKQPYTEYDTLTVHCSSQEHAHTASRGILRLQ